MGAPKFVLGRHKIAAASGGIILGPNLIISPNGPYTSGNWGATNVTETTGQTDPLGGTSASLLTDNAVSGQHFVQATAWAPFAGLTYLLSYYVKPGTYPNKITTQTGSGFNVYLEFDGTTHVAGDGGGTSLSNLSSVAVANGFFLVSGNFTAPASGGAGFLLGFNHLLGSYVGTSQTFTLWGVSVQTST